MDTFAVGTLLDNINNIAYTAKLSNQKYQNSDLDARPLNVAYFLKYVLTGFLKSR